MFDELKNDAAGLEILRDWLGDGGAPVPQADATRRSRVCVGCPENQAPRWWEYAKSNMARVIKKHLEVKHRTGLQVDVEDQLGICRVCRCCLPLKIHVPIAHIEAHSDPEAWGKFPAFCWQRAETNR